MLTSLLINLLLFGSLLLLDTAIALAITAGHCYKNVTVKYQTAVAKTRLKLDGKTVENYVDLEDRTRVDRVRICCTGYRTIIFGLCAPICQETCPDNSYCAEPNKCVCRRGYEESHNHHMRALYSKPMQILQCRPVCMGGCPTQHSHCIAHNKCGCHAGYKDVSSWFSTLRCEPIQCPDDQVYDARQRRCLKVEMNLEQLMQKVAQKLEQGLNEQDYEEEEELELAQPLNSQRLAVTAASDSI